MEIVKIDLNTLLTILGWLIGAWWAIQQVKFAHNQNIDLQRKLIVQQLKNNLSQDFLSIYLGISESINNLKNSCSHLLNNMSLAEKADTLNIKCGWQELIEPVNEKYSEICRIFNHLEAWVSASGGHIKNEEEITRIIIKFKDDFTIVNGLSDGHPWCTFQAVMARIRIHQSPDAELLNNEYLKIKESLDEISRSIKKQAKLVQKYLLTPEL